MNTFVDIFMDGGNFEVRKRILKPTVVLEIRDRNSSVTLYFENPEVFKEFTDKLNSEIKDESMVGEYNVDFDPETGECIEPADDLVGTWMEISDVKKETIVDKNAGEL